MTKSRTVTLVVAALLSVSLLSSCVEAAADMVGVMMKDGKMMMMKDGKATGPMDREMTMADGSMVMPDGTMKMKDGKETRMKEGEMMTMDGKMMEDGKATEGGKATKMEGMKM